MYFNKKNNIFYTFFFNLNTLTRYFVLFVFLLFIFAIWFFSIYTTFIDKENQLSSEIINLKQKEITFAKISKELQDTKSDIIQLNNQINIILESYENNEYQNSIDLLINFAKKSGLNILKCSFEGISNKKLYDKEKITISLLGTFNEIMEFFKLLITSKQWFTCFKMNLLQVDNNNIQIDCIYNFYVPKKGVKWFDQTKKTLE